MGGKSMLFHVYGDHALSQWAAMLCVLLALILLNEFARRTKAGGLLMFGVIPAVLTVYFIVIVISAAGEPSGPLRTRLMFI